MASRKRSSYSELSDADLIEELAIREARADFWAYRRYMEPDMKIGWWVREVTRQLMIFYLAWIAGKRPSLVIQAPPQHGKSVLIIMFISWVAGKHPEKRTIYASFSDRLGTRANLRLQRIFRSEKFQKVFPHTKTRSTSREANRTEYQENNSFIEFVGEEGSFRNTTINGQITGESLDLGIIDDPIKGRKEARSKTVRDSTWDWLQDDFGTRFSDEAAQLIILTRWHIDDPVGRLIDIDPTVKVLKYPAIAANDDEFRKKGEPLFPEHKSLEFLLIKKSRMTLASWESIYQQNPIAVGSGLFANMAFEYADKLPAQKEIVKSIRYWDKAGTEGGGAFTAGVLIHQLTDGRWFIEDVTKGQWSPANREKRIKQTANIDGKKVIIWVEQEPGSGGKESAQNTIKMLSGWIVKADRVTGDKESRAEPYAAQVEGGNIILPRGRPWVKSFVEEHEIFPNGKYKDQVDAASGAFNKLNASRIAGPLKRSAA